MTTEVRSAADVEFDPASGLVAAIVRDASSGSILMLAWMNAEALQRSLESGEAWFWSRSRRALWHKGATSGATQRIVSIATDCDRDALLVDVEPRGPACHTGRESCFGDRRDGFLGALTETLRDRKATRPAGSYSAALFEGGRSRILGKVGEEAAEVVVAAAAEGRERLVSETADLLYHLSVLLVSEDLDWPDVVRELESRVGRRRKS
ncbi:MAG: bifunctional phosphoribosyl-AMP cyclohydrolase/phosphoribosyl-ATP diphosphatase HisIE [Thermoanaerobaculia bacterium]